MSECYICGYTSEEVIIVNSLCSVHTCEECGGEGFATGDDGRIFCDTHGCRCSNEYLCEIHA